MPMPLAANQTALGENLYFFTSPVANTTACLIWGHGGLFHGDGQFAVLPGLTLHFEVVHGQTNSSNPTTSIQQSHHRATASGEALATGSMVPNYGLRKGVGSGWTKGSDAGFTYAQVETNMNTNQSVFASNGGWCPHVVSIRRRIGQKIVLLSDVVQQINTAHPNITDIYCGACRSDHSNSAMKSKLIRAVVQTLK